MGTFDWYSGNKKGCQKRRTSKPAVSRNEWWESVWELLCAALIINSAHVGQYDAVKCHDTKATPQVFVLHLKLVSCFRQQCAAVSLSCEDFRHFVLHSISHWCVFVRFLGGVCVLTLLYTVASERIETHIYQLDFVFKCKLNATNIIPIHSQSRNLYLDLL